MNIIELINRRRLIQGPKDKLMCVSPLKHKWAWTMLDAMEENTWFPKSIAMNDDILCYRERLTPAKRGMYDKALAFLSNLDGIQFNNLITNIGSHITSPEVSMVLARQAYEEANHVRAYSTMTEAISLEPHKIYGMYLTDEILAKKNATIMQSSDALMQGEFTPKKFAYAVIGNICLEGIFFYSGFLDFYWLAKEGEMIRSADQIKYIQRDEETHLAAFVHMYFTLQQENPEIFDADFYAEAEKIFRASVELEIAWGKHTSHGVISDEIIDNYIKHLANKRTALLGWDALYPGVRNPVPWVDKFSAINGVETNFFEGKPTDYQAGGGLEWD
ncbi:ribonucleotide-diphosphate reductase subunit beta [Herbaspirillum huttiense]|uniref:Ribonucleoside-diphosphate reductase subunit beta n=1 Tax=Herbaspirillum huttiense subsp. lycopersici TaxID=3074428 RepID=A0ABU2EG48_9BURK|nr:ribonucleotide-diphosphate reductase subunit beta [Herbaspirillum huttiense]MDR9847106.1 ribonucleotide-diphosphate reductase subunit beta [Herbaspirillum huttiense SE1]